VLCSRLPSPHCRDRGETHPRGAEEAIETMMKVRNADPIRRSRLGLLGPLGGAIAIALLMALTPVATAAHPSTTLLAPFVGTHSNSYKSSSAVCGIAGGMGAKWKSASGVLTGSAKSSVRSCPYVSQFAYSSSTRTSEVSVPISLPFQGEYNASVAFNYKINPSMSVTTSTCPSAANYTSGYDEVECYWFADWYVEVMLQLYDQTNGTYVGTTDSYWEATNLSETGVYNLCYYGSCSTGGGSFTGSSANDDTYQAPGYDGVAVYLPNGPAVGTGSLWTNSTSWSSVYGYGTNYTLLLSDSYVILATFSFGTYTYLEGYNFYDTGVTSGTQYFNPAGSASASVVASGAGHDLKVTSADYNLV
jgi:hypothetical protein